MERGALVIAVALLQGCPSDECEVDSDCGRASRCRLGTCEARRAVVPPGLVDGGFRDYGPRPDAKTDAEAGTPPVGAEPRIGAGPRLGADGGDASGDSGVDTWPPQGYLRIEAGSFLRGSSPAETNRNVDEGPQRTITISRAFLIKATEVTSAEFRAVMGFDPSAYVGCGDDCPVNSVSWNLAVRYVNQLSSDWGFAACYQPDGSDWTFTGVGCQGYRLPTEAEWEYAARAGSTLPLSNGLVVQPRCSPPDPTLDQVGWFCGNSSSMVNGCPDLTPIGGPACAGPQPVQQKEANAFGLFDVHGNALEWVHDRYDPYYYATAPATDPTGPEVGDERGLRGGGWPSLAAECRSAARDKAAQDAFGQHVGIRPVITAP